MAARAEPRSGEIVTPGMKIGASSNHSAAFGAYESGSHIYATLVGVLNETSGPGKDGRLFLSVTPTRSTADTVATTIPDVDRTVTVRVVKVTPRAAHTEILLCDGVPLVDLFKGTIRQQDVRQTEVDKVEIYRCFRPGDIVVAEVISLGDRHSYFLSTAKNELGVVHAEGPAGVPMLPISWQEMQCPKTKTREFRKVAKQP